VGENIFQLYIRQKNNNQDIQGTLETKLSKNQKTNEEMGK
jgi:hypothetical protein